MNPENTMPPEKATKTGNHNGFKLIRALEVSAIVFSVVTGFCSTGLIVFKGGQLAQTVSSHDKRLEIIEARGSPQITAHMKEDEARDLALRERITRLEEIYKIALDMRSEISRMSQKLDDLKETVTGIKPKQ